MQFGTEVRQSTISEVPTLDISLMNVKNEFFNENLGTREHFQLSIFEIKKLFQKYRLTMLLRIWWRIQPEHRFGRGDF